MPSSIARSIPARPTSDQIPQLLHALNQPLSLLRCSLEGVLSSPRTSDEYRESLRESLRLAEEICVWTAGIRELLNAEADIPRTEEIDLDRLIQDAVEDLRGIAGSLGLKFVLKLDSGVRVACNRRQLSKAIFYVLEYAIDTMSPGVIEVGSVAQTNRIVFTVQGGSLRKCTESQAQGFHLDFPPRFGFRIARGIFALAGGTLDSYYERERLMLTAELER